MIKGEERKGEENKGKENEEGTERILLKTFMRDNLRWTDTLINV